MICFNTVIIIETFASNNQYRTEKFRINMLKWVVKSEANLAERVPANDCPLSNNFDVIFYCSVGERSGALTLLNAASDLTGILQTDDQGFSLPELKAHGSFFYCLLSIVCPPKF